MSTWFSDAIFYHIYPLGLVGAPPTNDPDSPPVSRLTQVQEWIEHLADLGMNALYLGPVFQSMTHGYDTTDYYRVDSRLGAEADLRAVVNYAHSRGVRVVLDAVFNHVGRGFWAFEDVLTHREDSAYTEWFHELRFGESSPYGDPFSYHGWNGCMELVKLNLRHPHVRDHLFDAVRRWVEAFDIDGLRLDAADCMDPGFLAELRRTTDTAKSDFLLLGEMVHGDYRGLANPTVLHTVTNYECYKGLHSSFNDGNLFEIAHSLQRQFGDGGLYRGIPLYNFAENHDVDRVASTLHDSGHLYSLYALLFTMPGIPCVYYAGEWGFPGTKSHGSDALLRPTLTVPEGRDGGAAPDLECAVRRFAHLRRESPALRRGGYRQLAVRSRLLAFARETQDETVVVVVNANDAPERVEVNLGTRRDGVLRDLLDGGEPLQVVRGRVEVAPLYPRWPRVLRLEP
jgi:cyclomaltodextrinase / maltogenic alpha-amylase / neopullulanase